MVFKYVRVLLLPFLMALAGCGSGSSSDGSDFLNDGAGVFSVSLSDAVRAKNTERWNQYITLQLEAALVPLNRLSGLLNQAVPINYDECGIQNAFYSSATQSITLCDELVEDIYRFFGQRVGADRPAQTANALVFVLYHEIAHALVDILNISVLGNDESAADGIATVIAVETGRSFAAIISGAYLSTAPTSYADEHNNGQDRFGDISCWALGGDDRLLSNSTLVPLVTRFNENNRACSVEYEARSSSAMALIPALIGLSEQESTDPTVIALNDPNPPKFDDGTTTDLVQLLASVENDFWRCSATNANSDVGYRFSGATGLFQILDGESNPFDFTYVLSVENSQEILLTYAASDVIESMSNFQFATQGSFTATSNLGGELSCLYTDG